MNWVRTNRFLAVFLCALIVGAGALGYLISTSYARYSEISATYDQQATELQRLQKLTPYPEEASLKKYEDQKKEYADAVLQLQRQLSSDSPAPENVGATEFQTRLRDAVAGVTAQARQNNVTLPQGFYLGFEQYRSTVPAATAAPLLAMQLKAYDQIARLLIGQKVDAITVFKRAPLAQESAGSELSTQTPAAGGAGNAAAARGGPGAKGGAATAAAPLVTIYPLEIEFHSPRSPLHAVLDEMVKARPFYIVRAVRIRNERDKGPVRGALTGGPEDNIAGANANLNAPPAADTGGNLNAPGIVPPPVVSSPGPGARPAPSRLPGVPEPPLPDRPTLRYVVGTERLDAAVRLELVRFGQPQ